MKILITAFDPFGGECINPALEGVMSLPDNILGNEIIKKEIPTVFNKSLKVIEESIEENNPDIIICIGQAMGRSSITPERVAINVNDALILDNEKNQPIDERIFEDGDNAYFSNLPIKAITKALQEAGIPSTISNSAGTFVCNHVMYGVLYLINKKYKDKKGGFIHIPALPSQVVNKPNYPSMSLEHIVEGLKLAIKVCIEKEDDDKFIGGSIL